MTNKDIRIKELEKALRPFAHPDFCRIHPSNSEGVESPVFQRNDAILKVKDFCRAREALEGNPR